MLAGTRVARGVGALALGEQAIGQTGTAGQGQLQALDLEQVEADGDDGPYSTVTVLARLRGWSTFSPRRRAIA